MGTQRKKRVPLGKPLPPLPDDIEIVTQADIDRARIAVSKLGDDIFNAMVNAEPEDTLFDA